MEPQENQKKNNRKGMAIFWWCLAACCLGLVIWYVFWEGPRETPKSADTISDAPAYVAPANGDSAQ